MNSNEENNNKTDNEEDIFLDNLKETLQAETIVSLYITESGEFVMLTNGEMNEVQRKITNKMLVAADPGASFVFKSILFVEMLIQKLEHKITRFFKVDQ
jgi:hypothetical protein